ncbi:nitroreductase family deazaflavin-dependent oxidoreductase [Mycobacterium sp. M1]|uniref:Nitroreductase family deazaflavin-dependent oxidoreductase n=1 Tax=Mycolicibacter acidiphilus TaxID=2835306 RepID=A0ABS5RJU5_9MYCO|nr:nitroreductase family deazaflavin-dependent oxidoreductase [Mycolicibacter acidiphilus]MBS9534297.1 nitroreductase family deazaflavin-dependent oxidoreductase [Mycolicibacter acidiphilus]
MRIEDEYKSKPGVPYIFPDWLDGIQNKYVSPLVKRFQRYIPTFTVIEHKGRKSGKPYKTVVHGYTKGSSFAVMLGHGKADWVRNVLAAGGADVHLFRRSVHITNPRIVPIGGDVSNLPLIVRLAARRVGILVADIDSAA